MPLLHTDDTIDRTLDLGEDFLEDLWLSISATHACIASSKKLLDESGAALRRADALLATGLWTSRADRP